MGQDVGQMPVSGSVDQLADVLERHCGTYEDLCALLFSERDALMENDIDELASLLLAQQELMFQVATDEDVRMTIQSGLAASLGMDRDASLGDLLEQGDLSTSERDRLGRARARMSALVEQVESINEDNRDLVHQALKFIAYSLDGVRLLAGGGTTYDRTRSRDRSGALLVDRKF